MKNGLKGFPENQALTWTNSTGGSVAAGTPILVGGAVAVTATTIANGESGAVHRAGRFSFTKATGFAAAVGDGLYWDAGNSRVSNDPTDGFLIGTCAEAAGSSATSVKVDIGGFFLQPVKGAIVGDNTASAFTLDLGFAGNPSFLSVTVWSAADPSVPSLPASVNRNDADGTVDVNLSANLATGARLEWIAFP